MRISQAHIFQHLDFGHCRKRALSQCCVFPCALRQRGDVVQRPTTSGTLALLPKKHTAKAIDSRDGNAERDDGSKNSHKKGRLLKAVCAQQQLQEDNDLCLLRGYYYYYYYYFKPTWSIAALLMICFLQKC